MTKQEIRAAKSKSKLQSYLAGDLEAADGDCDPTADPSDHADDLEVIHWKVVEDKKRAQASKDRQTYKKVCCMRWLLVLTLFVAVVVTLSTMAALVWLKKPPATPRDEWTLLPNVTQEAILANATSPQAKAWEWLQHVSNTCLYLSSLLRWTRSYNIPLSNSKA